MSVRMSDLKSPMHRNQSSDNIIQAKRQSIVKMTDLDENGELEGDALFQANYETTWTISDQHRLLAIDRLQTRTLEYHNNVHLKSDHLHQVSSSAENDDVVAQILFCSPKGSDRPFPVTKGKLSSTLQSIRQKENDKSLTWVHLFDLSEFDKLAAHFDIHHLCHAGFRDLRSHSNIIQSNGGFLMSLCYFQMSNSNLKVQMFKLFCYIAKGVTITFIAELMPDTEMMAEEGEDAGAGDDINCVCSVVMEKWMTLIKRSCEMGPLYICYELAMEAIRQQDTLIEFFSRTLFFFKKKTSLSLSHRKKVAFMRKMHIIMSAIQLVEFFTESLLDIFRRLVRKAEESAALNHGESYSHGAADGAATPSTAAAPPSSPRLMGLPMPHSTEMPLISPSLVGGVQLPYLYDILDACEFMDDCLQREANEARILTAAMDAVSQLKANNTAMLLSLVATIFLPVTFLTGVFGMNFTIDGGFTIDLVNSPYGPGVFYMMCGIVVLAILAYFISKGWIELYSIKIYFKKLFCCMQPGMVDADLDGEEDSPARTRKMSDASSLKQKRNSGDGGVNGNSQSRSHPALQPAASAAAAAASATSTRTSTTRASFAPRDSMAIMKKHAMDKAIQEDIRRTAEANRKRQAAKEAVTYGSRNNAARFESMSSASALGASSVTSNRPFE